MTQPPEHVEPKRLRSCLLGFYATPEEKAAIKVAAEKEKLKVADFVRRATLKNADAVNGSVPASEAA